MVSYLHDGIKPEVHLLQLTNVKVRRNKICLFNNKIEKNLRKDNLKRLKKFLKLIKPLKCFLRLFLGYRWRERRTKKARREEEREKKEEERKKKKKKK